MRNCISATDTLVLKTVEDTRFIRGTGPAERRITITEN